MYHTPTVVGVDPGIVDTGIVVYRFFPNEHMLEVKSVVLHGAKAIDVFRAISDNVRNAPSVFIEKYRPRSNFGTDSAMTEFQAQLKQMMPKAKLLNNTGVKSVVTQRLLETLHSWDFDIPTHHQDLRSAARIAILGMMKDEELNELLSDFMRDYFDGKAWDVT